MERNMYVVTIINSLTNRAIDRKEFSFGDWSEIGFWLDDNGYNEARYSVAINFVVTRVTFENCDANDPRIILAGN
jgi:hypothetical protein